MKTKRVAQNHPSATHANRCLFSTSDGRQCTMLRHESHPSLCPFHARQERQLLDSAAIAAELASLSGEFTTASDLSHVLGKLFHLLAQDRVPRRKAATLAYIAQLLLHNRRSVQLEIQQTHGFSAWEETLRRALPRPCPGQPSGTACPDEVGAVGALPPIPSES